MLEDIDCMFEAIHSSQRLSNCAKHTLLGKLREEWGDNDKKKNVDCVHFQHFNPFFIIFMANFVFDNHICIHVLRGKGV